VAEGKRSTYLKDDRAYQSYLIQRIRDEWRIELVNPEGMQHLDRWMSGGDLGRFLENIDRVRDKQRRLHGRGFPPEALRIALRARLLGRDDLNRPEVLDKVLAGLGEVARFSDIRLLQDEEHGGSAIVFSSRQDGVDREVRLDWGLLTSAEYRSLASNKDGLEALDCAYFRLAHGEEEPTEHASLDAMLDKLYEGAKKGTTIQRYKGLGEMNAEQLWETTMDPKVRTLLQVRIEDAVAADEIFTVLMGDQVEPRRDFIVQNALEVKNLDV
jgi:DNA gyrase subunit B